MPHAAGVSRGPDVDPGAGAGRAVAAHDIAVFVPSKVRQLVHADKVEGFALIVVPVSYTHLLVAINRSFSFRFAVPVQLKPEILGEAVKRRN